MESNAASAAYKSAKEAFHADNGGSSIMSINAISLTALTAYAIYAARSRPSQPIWDYIETVLPLLLSITDFSRQPLVFNAWLLCIFGLCKSRQSRAPVPGNTRKGPKSKGKWLEESDSDEEPAKPQIIRPTRSGVPVPLPSEVIASSAASPTLSTLSSAPSELRSRCGRSRRGSDEDTRHTAINVLPTPEMLPNGSMAAQQASYPSRRTQAVEERPRQSKGRLPFLSVYRAHMMIMTVHSILAVDFAIFPRWLGKTETFGTSLMDIGVGSFVFSLGIISTRSHLKATSMPKFVLNNIKKSIPIIAMGMVRVIMVKGVEYPEHVTEYGVHWNFFFTLALMPIFGAVVWPLKKRGLSWTLLGALLTIWHQTFLSTTPLQSFVLSPGRASLIEQNKEGLVSLPGYLAIYLLGLATGQLISRIQDDQASGEERYIRKRTELALELSGYAIAYWAALASMRWGGMQVSRRMANMPYVLWTAAYNVTFLLSYLAIEIFVVPPTSQACPPLLEAVNKNSLAIFLAANLLTGVVNMRMRTMYAEWYTAMGVLVVYSAGLCALAWGIRGIRIGL